MDWKSTGLDLKSGSPARARVGAANGSLMEALCGSEEDEEETIVEGVVDTILVLHSEYTGCPISKVSNFGKLLNNANTQEKVLMKVCLKMNNICPYVVCP